jgi:predicted aspartyl protease
MSRPTLHLFIASLVILPSSPAGSETVPLERQHGTYMISVQINGALVLPFILDTGASFADSGASRPLIPE